MSAFLAQDSFQLTIGTRKSLSQRKQDLGLLGFSGAKPSAAEVKKSYDQFAKEKHSDKGGSKKDSRNW